MPAFRNVVPIYALNNIYIYYIPIAYGHGKALTILPPLRRDIHTRYGTNLTALVETAVLKKRKETNSVKAPPNMLNTKTILYIPQAPMSASIAYIHHCHVYIYIFFHSAYILCLYTFVQCSFCSVKTEKI